MIQKTKKNDEQNENESPENIPILKIFNLTNNWIKSFTLENNNKNAINSTQCVKFKFILIVCY